VNNGFFDVCQGCPAGTGDLLGTGIGGACATNTVTDGGGTVWLTTTAPVVPGEDMEMEFVIFDVQDHGWDSTVLIDAFQWSLVPSGVSTG
jgi:hypothetical protein